MSSKNYYAVLGVSPAADADAIRAAFRMLMSKYHPDINDGAAAAERAAEVSEAFAVLGKTVTRNAYDAARAAKAASVHRRRDDLIVRTVAGVHDGTGDDLFGATTKKVEEQAPNNFRSQLSALLRSVLVDVGESLAPGGLSGNHRKAALQRIVRWAAGVCAFLFIIVSIRAGIVAAFARDDQALRQAPSNLSAAVKAAPPPVVAVATPVAQTDLSQPAIEDTSIALVDAHGLPALDPATVRSALQHFLNVFYARGIEGAMSESKRCHEEASAAKQWSKLDACIAFDDSGAYFESHASDSAAPAAGAALPGPAPAGYFSLIANTSAQVSAYLQLSSNSVAVSDRLQELEHGVLSNIQPATLQQLLGVSNAPPTAVETAAKAKNGTIKPIT